MRGGMGNNQDAVCSPSLTLIYLNPQLVIAGLQTGQWGRKRAAAEAVLELCNAAGDALGTEHAPPLLDALLKVRTCVAMRASFCRPAWR